MVIFVGRFVDVGNQPQFSFTFNMYGSIMKIHLQMFYDTCCKSTFDEVYGQLVGFEEEGLMVFLMEGSPFSKRMKSKS